MYKLAMIYATNKAFEIEFNDEESAIEMFNDFIMWNNQNIEILTKKIKEKNNFDDDINIVKYMYLVKDNKIIDSIDFKLTHEILLYFIDKFD